MTEKVKELSIELFKKVREVNKNTKHDVFLRFYGHTNSIGVFYFRNGFKYNKKLIYIAKNIYLNKDDAEEKLRKVLKKLEELEELSIELFMKVLEVNENTKHDVILGFNGHVNSIYVDYCKNGYSEDKNFIDIIDPVYLNCKSTEKELEEALKKLEELEEEK